MTTTRQLAIALGLDPWTVLVRPRLWARADAVLAMSADIRAGALAAQGKPVRDARGRFVGRGK
jgi:hypothetical protein